MLSRIADSLFWLNRYMERADGLLRVVRTHYILSLDKGMHTNLTWRPVLEMFTYSDDQTISSLENETSATLKLLVTDATNSNSLKILLTRARENARGVQDHITKEVWEHVNQMYHAVNHAQLESKLSGSEALETVESFIRNSILFTGVTDTTMPRGMGWSFMNLGRYIERCTQTIEITDKQYRNIFYNLNTPVNIMQWRSLLLSLSGYELHLKTYHTSDHNKNVLHQVLINHDFTRSVFYSLERVYRYFEDVMKENKSEENENLEKLFGRLYSQVKFVDFGSLDGINLQHFLEDVRHNLMEFSKRLAQNFFSYS